MRKNGSRLISFKQYKFTDLFLFAVILFIFDLIAHFAPIAMEGAAYFIYTLTVPIVLLVMIRWGWPCVFFAVGDGIIQSLLNNTGVWQSYVSYSVGNCFMLLLLPAVKLIGKQRVTQTWYGSVLFMFCGWALQILGVSVTMWLTTVSTGGNFTGYLLSNMGFGLTGFMSLAAGIVIILIVRRLDGICEDQKHYLLRLDAERREMSRRDEFGDEPIEIDDELLAVLRRDHNQSGE